MTGEEDKQIGRPAEKEDRMEMKQVTRKGEETRKEKETQDEKKLG